SPEPKDSGEKQWGRPEGTFELRDVPYVEYFSSGYALHAAYWHDVFGTARSHGCINLSPIDAHHLFLWTDPPVPENWHGVFTTKDTPTGTLVYVHESTHRQNLFDDGAETPSEGERFGQIVG